MPHGAGLLKNTKNLPQFGTYLHLNISQVFWELHQYKLHQCKAELFLFPKIKTFFQKCFRI